MKKLIDLERRSRQDRRQKHIPFFKLASFTGKRCNLRRADDCKRITILDHYPPSLFLFILLVLSLSLVDALLTLILLERGAVELNPVMRYYIALGPGTFVVTKYALTALSLMIMFVLHVNISARYRIESPMFLFSGLAFGSVVTWELYLLAYIS